MDLLDWLTGSDTETYSSAKPPEFLGTQKDPLPRGKTSPPQSPGQSSSKVKSNPGSSSKTPPKSTPQHPLTPLESRIKNIILSVYSNKWIGEEASVTPEEVGEYQSPNPDEEHKRLHSLSSTDSQPNLRLSLNDGVGLDTDLSVEVVKDEEECQTLGLGRLASLLPPTLLHAGPIGSESVDFDPTTVQVPPHIRRPESPRKGTRLESPRLPVELDFASLEQELVPRTAPEGVSDSDTDLPKVVAPAPHSQSKHQLPPPQKYAVPRIRPLPKMSGIV